MVSKIIQGLQCFVYEPRLHAIYKVLTMYSMLFIANYLL